MSYNTDQWLVFNYPAGAGGKFLTTCFLQFDKIAHWSGNQLPPNETINWYSNSIPKEDELWPNKEIDTPWVLPGISRAWPRGVDTSEDEFNARLSASDNSYLHSCWNDGLVIPDFWHKSKRPAWWTNAQWVSIYVDDWDLYKRITFSKLFEYKDNVVIDTSQRPNVGRAPEQYQKSIFQNPWKWENVTDYNQFFDETIMMFPYMQAWDFTALPAEPYITLSELFDVDHLYNFMLTFEDRFEQPVSKEYIKELHNIWLTATKEKMSLLP